MIQKLGTNWNVSTQDNWRHYKKTAASQILWLLRGQRLFRKGFLFCLTVVLFLTVRVAIDYERPVFKVGTANRTPFIPLNKIVIAYREYTPRPDLLPFVECFWTLQSDSRFFNQRELVIPGGRAELIFNFGNAIRWYDSIDSITAIEYAGTHLLGQRNRYFFMEMEGMVDVVAARFRQGGFSSFTRMPVNQFLNRLVPVHDIFGAASVHWTDQLYAMDGPEAKVKALEALLFSLVNVKHDTYKTLQLISVVKQQATDNTITSICDQTGIHYKKLERIFSHHTGYNPKNFSRVIRFYRTLKEMTRRQAPLTQVGLQHGYYDQAHFIRDFKTFTGRAPGQFPMESAIVSRLLLKSEHV